MGGLTPEPSLGTFLAEVEAAVPGAVLRVSEPLSTRYEITALQYGLERVGRRPIVVVERPLLAEGAVSEIPVVTNLMASRLLAARVLGVTDHRRASAELASRMGDPIDPVVVPRAEAAVAAVAVEGTDVDLRRLPALVQHDLDPGPYLSAAHATTWDPESGIDNTAIQRAWVHERTLRYFPYPSSHNWTNIQRWWERGEDAPVAFWIGAHPALDIGANQKIAYPESHWSRAGAVLGRPVRLTATSSFGDRLRVPADAEIVIEGFVRRDTFLAEGPFGEYTGYAGSQRPSPVVDVRAVSMRREPLYHDYGSGLADMLVPENLMLEASLYEAMRPVVPSLDALHIPSSGKRFHCYVRLAEPEPGDAARAIEVALANRRIKHVVVVDEDIDVFDDSEVLWAVATRVQWDRDVVVAVGQDCSLLDPSLRPGAVTSDKAGIDATLPVGGRGGSPRPFAAVNRVPSHIDPLAVLARAAGRHEGLLAE